MPESVRRKELIMGLDIHEWANRELTDYTVPQPPPKNDENAVPLWPLIIGECEERAVRLCRPTINREDETTAQNIRSMVADMKQRHEFGVAKYGVPLVAHNGRDHLSDAYQELLDVIVYF
jgi:hypothetical protein